MTGYKFLLKQAIGTVVVCKHTHYATIPGHDDIDIAWVGLAMQLLTDNRENTAMFATHISKVA